MKMSRPKSPQKPKRNLIKNLLNKSSNHCKKFSKKPNRFHRWVSLMSNNKPKEQLKTFTNLPKTWSVTFFWTMKNLRKKSRAHSNHSKILTYPEYRTTTLWRILFGPKWLWLNKKSTAPLYSLTDISFRNKNKGSCKTSNRGYALIKNINPCIKIVRHLDDWEGK